MSTYTDNKYIYFDRLITKAVENNIIVLDAYGKPGYLTKRLLFLMKSIARKNSNKIDTIYIPTDIPPDFTTKEIIQRRLFGITCWDLNLITSIYFDDEGEGLAVKKFLSIPNTYMPANYSSLILGTGPNNYVLLGATNGCKT